MERIDTLQKIKKRLLEIPILNTLLIKTFFIYMIMRSLPIGFYYLLSAPFFRERKGIITGRREFPVIVSLTTIPQRIHRVHICLESLLRQSLKPDRLILWIAETDWDKIEDLPASILRFKKRGLTIKFCKDIRSFKKIIYTLKEYPKSRIVTADDDILYSCNWLRELVEAHEKEPEYIHCQRAHLITSSHGKINPWKRWNHLCKGFKGPSLRLFPTGSGGVLYEPRFLHREVFKEEVFMKICPTGDDIWLKAMSLLNRIPCKKVHSSSRRYPLISDTIRSALSANQNTAENYQRQITAVFEYYDLYKSLALGKD